MYKIFDNKSLKENEKELQKINPKIEITEESLFYCIFIENTLIGYAILKEGNKLEEIFIVKAQRYKSYGVKLIEFIKNHLATKNQDVLYLECYEKNQVFFKKVGFKKSIENYYAVDELTKKRKRKKEGIRSTVYSIIINIILAGLKIFFGLIGRSKALVADGFHSVSDVVGSIVVLIGIHLGDKPADEDHPYGHGKLESIAGNIIGVILVVTAYSLILENINFYLNESVRVIPEKITLIIVVISIIVKYGLYRYKYNIGMRIKNDAVLADAREHKSDVLSSVAVLIGIVLSIYIDPIFDIILGVGVGLIIGKEGLSIIFQTSNSLMDIQDKKLLDSVQNYVNKFDNVENSHDIRMKTSGNMIYLTFHIRLDGNMKISEGHDISDDIKYSILNKYEEVGDVTIHVDCRI
ncbi:MAG: GNAT family N-acetyltransferase [Psychrilyobacter sp.]|nr:GNAT family N-acetyltransferase [Psychrilyobacter sp.]